MLQGAERVNKGCQPPGSAGDSGSIAATSRMRGDALQGFAHAGRITRIGTMPLRNGDPTAALTWPRCRIVGAFVTGADWGRWAQGADCRDWLPNMPGEVRSGGVDPVFCHVNRYLLSYSRDSAPTWLSGSTTRNRGGAESA
jgi:hypothetical protein